MSEFRPLSLCTIRLLRLIVNFSLDSPLILHFPFKKIQIHSPNMYKLYLINSISNNARKVDF